MTNLVSQADPRSLSTEEIHAEISGFATLGVAVVERWAVLMRELARRKEKSPMFAHPIMQFWRSIAERTLHSEAVVLLADLKHVKMIKAILPLPRDRQIAIAKGEKIPVATRAPDGMIKSDDLPIMRMDPATLRRAFGPKGIRTVHEQAEMIRAEGRIERRGMFTVLRDEGIVRLGNQKFALTDPDFQAAARDLGYEIVLARDVSRRAG